MKRKLIWSAVWVILIAALLGWAFFPRAISVQLASAKQVNLIERLRVDGKFHSPMKWLIPAFADGEMRRMPLEVGDRVKKGDRITEIFWDFRFDALRSPVSGVVSKVFRQSEGPIRRGDPILEVVDPQKLQIVAELLTPEAVQVAVGNPVTIRNWGGEGTLEGTVSRVSRAGFTKPSALGVEEERTEVTIVPTTEWPADARQKLGSDFYVEVEIETRQTANALVIPVGAIFRDGENWAAYLFREGRASLTHLELGRRNDELVQILSGVRAGEQVVVYPGELIRPGSKLKSSGA
ncbi:MAG: efflux RND transporter periplasmic adaptor subunit [Oligoflexia bacterium]